MSSVIAFGKSFEAGLAPAGLSTFAAAVLVFAAAGFALAGFAAAFAGAALAAVFLFGAAAAFTVLGASLSAAALAFAFAGAVVLAAFATCLSLSPSISAPASREASSTPSRIFREIPPIIYVLPLSATVQALPLRQWGERFAVEILCFARLPHRAWPRGDPGQACLAPPFRKAVDQ
ncbi:hypothetical protein [Mesorhizobium sp. CA8]|uniref:hypothetical protein n=1 Tax=Mesorhizobium sp. CA8 TaxID=2876637 RepID=UPI001CCD0C10|nr:hypothetical protein [Mesorhizobium sp. CA8]